MCFATAFLLVVMLSRLVGAITAEGTLPSEDSERLLECIESRFLIGGSLVGLSIAWILFVTLLGGAETIMPIQGLSLAAFLCWLIPRPAHVSRSISLSSLVLGASMGCLTAWTSLGGNFATLNLLGCGDSMKAGPTGKSEQISCVWTLLSLAFLCLPVHPLRALIRSVLTTTT